MTVEVICRLMAKTWKDNGGDAMGFYWLQDIIRMEILNLEEGFTPRDVAQILCDNSPRCDDSCTHTSTEEPK